MGLLMGAALAGVGQGLTKYNELEEKQRAEQVATDRAYGAMDYKARLEEEAKTKAEEKQKAKMEAFKADADAWRKANPDASKLDFIAHFSDTEHAALLGPVMEAAKLMSADEVQKAQIAHYQEQDRIAKANAERQAAHERRMEGAAARAESRAATKEKREQAEYEEKKALETQKKGLLAGYVTSKEQGLFGAAEKYASEAEKLGLDFRGKPEGIEREIKYVDDKGREITEKQKANVPNATRVPAGFNATSDFAQGGNGPQIFENSATGQRIAFDAKKNDWGVYEKLPAKPGEKPGAKPTEVVKVPEPVRNWHTDTPRTQEELNGMLLAAKNAPDTPENIQRLKELQNIQDRWNAEKRGKGMKEYLARSEGGAPAPE